MGHQDTRIARLNSFHPFLITQAEWYIDSANGNDGNSGLMLATALRTIEEFNNRTAGGKFAQPTEVFLHGDHSGSSFDGYYSMAPGGSFLVNGMTPTTLDTDTITGFTAENPGGDETTTLTVAGKDWTTAGPGGSSLIDKRIRITSGAAIGAIAWIAVEDPGSVGTATVRVSRFAKQTTLLEIPVTFVNPSPGDTYVVEDLTRIGGVDITLLQGLWSPPSFGANVQFTDLEIGTDFFSSLFGVGIKQGTIAAGCHIRTKIATLGMLDGLFCQFSGSLVRQALAPIQWNGSYMRPGTGGVMEIAFIDNLTFLDCVFQGCPVLCRGPNVLFGNTNAFFDTDTAISVGSNSIAGVVKFNDGELYGSGITTVGIEIISACNMTLDSVLPTLSGPTNAVSLGGTNYTTYAAAIAASPNNGAGIFTR